MDQHLTKDREFRSDKYDWCPVGFFALKFTDKKARKVIRKYAQFVKKEQPALARDLVKACEAVERR